MERSKADIAYDHVSGIDRNYPDWPSTFGPCMTNMTDECNNLARGCGYCADCHEKKLAEIVGKTIAKNFHESVKNRINSYARVYEAAGRDN